MKTRTKSILVVAATLFVLVIPAITQAQTTTTTQGTEDQNTYQLTFIDLAFKMFDIVLNFFVLLMQQFMTGFFGLFVP